MNAQTWTEVIAWCAGVADLGDAMEVGDEAPDEIFSSDGAVLCNEIVDVVEIGLGGIGEYQAALANGRDSGSGSLVHERYALRHGPCGRRRACVLGR